MAFRVEDYVAFVDESGDETFQVVTGLFMPARWMRSASTYLDDFRATEGIQQPEELKAAELATGRGITRRLARVRPRAPGVRMQLHRVLIGHDIYERALRILGNFNEFRVVAIGLPTRLPPEAYRIWFWAVCAGITSYRDPDRPRVPMTVIDGRDQGLLRIQRGVVKDFYIACRGRQPYITRGAPWFMGGAVLHESHSLPFIQMADLVAHAAFQAMLAAPGRAFMHGWYEAFLRAPARARGRHIDASQHCLEELRNCQNVPRDIHQLAATARVVG